MKSFLNSLFLVAVLAGQVFAATYYVQTDGNNGNAGTATGSGNAWADPGYAASQMAVGDLCYVKSGTYVVTTVTPGAGGPVLLPTDVVCRMEGYDTTPGDMCIGGTRPIVQASSSLNPASTCYLIQGNGTFNEEQLFVALEADGNSEPNTVGIKGDSANYVACFLCTSRNNASYGFDTIKTTACYSADNGGHGFNGMFPAFCYSYSNNGLGFNGGSAVVAFCISHGDVDGFAGYHSVYVNCVAYGNSDDGFWQLRNNQFINCVAVNCTGHGYDTADNTVLVNCADYNNTAGRTSGTPLADISPINLTGDPFTNAASGDFSLNNTAGAGAALRAAGIQVAEQTGYQDVGAVQHQSTGGSTAPVLNTNQ